MNAKDGSKRISSSSKLDWYQPGIIFSSFEYSIGDVSPRPKIKPGSDRYCIDDNQYLWYGPNRMENNWICLKRTVIGILPRTPPEILRRIFWCNKNFWENFFQHPIKPEVDRKLRYRTLRSAILIIRNTYMLRFEFLCCSYCCYKGHVSKLTEKSSSIDSNKSATVNPYFLQASFYHILNIKFKMLK